MAIRKNRVKAKLSPEDVLKIRSDFFHGRYRIEEIAFKYPVSERTISDAIHSKGAYKDIQDDIPQEDKDNRVQWRTFTSTKKSRKAREIRQSKKLLEDYYKWKIADNQRKWEEQQHVKKELES